MIAVLVGRPTELFSATMTYLDHAATSPMREGARQQLLEGLDVLGNAAALHRDGQRARAALEEARESVAASLGAHPTEVIFTSGGSEANSIAVLGSRLARPDRPRALISAIEHPSVLQAQSQGVEVIPATGGGIVDLPRLEAALADDVALVSVMTVNNETGIVQPLDELVELARRHGSWVHTDAVQAAGHVPTRFDNVDLMALSAHKIGGPVGIGALLARRNTSPKTIGLGGGQEREIRSGTPMVALARSFAAALAEAIGELDEATARLQDFQRQVGELCMSLGAHISTFDAEHAPHIVNATFPELRASDLLFLLDGQGISASVGSACRAGVHQPSEVLLAMGRTADEAAATVRFSFGHTTTQADIDHLASTLPEAVRRAQGAWAT